MLTFRKDIQGLRAIAAISVVVFHLEKSLLPGGFIGVDIFFVISGYLISRIIIEGLENETFAFSSFYIARAQRLLPPLYLMLFITTAFSLLFAFPQELEQYAESLLSSLVYFSNIYFYSVDDYFASDLELSLLLHTWSLSVEEQFYLVSPLVLFICFRLGARKLIFAVCCLGFVLGSYMTHYMTKIEPSLAFYMTPFRGFQFLLGAILAASSPWVRIGQVCSDALALAGVFALVYALWTFHGSMDFPGTAALWPTVGTALLIMAGTNDTNYTSRLLSCSPLVWFGKISYSMYLWHWPVVVFYKWLGRPTHQLTLVECAAGFVICTVLGYLSWLVSEKWVKAMRVAGSTKRLNQILIASTFSLFFIGAYVLYTDGLPERFSADQQKVLQYLDYDRYRERNGTCFMAGQLTSPMLFDPEKCIIVNEERPNVLLIGDSNAAHLIAPLMESYPDLNWSQANASGCKATSDMRGSWYCVELMQRVYDQYIDAGLFDIIVLSSRWSDTDGPLIKATIERWRGKVERVIVVGSIMEYEQALPRLLVRFTSPLGHESEKFAAARRIDSVMKRDQSFRSLLSDLESVDYWSLVDAMCDEETCLTLVGDNVPFQWDNHHLTHEGGLQLIQRLRLNGDSL